MRSSRSIRRCPPVSYLLLAEVVQVLAEGPAFALGTGGGVGVSLMAHLAIVCVAYVPTETLIQFFV